MQDVLYIEEVDQATTLLKPVRIDLLKRMAQPTTCVELGEALGESPQKIYYHVKAMEKAGLIEKVSEHKVRGILEGVYQAKARSYWLSPELAGRIGGKQHARDQMSLGYLLTLAEELQTDVGRLAQITDHHIPSLGLSAQITLRDQQERSAFLIEVQSLFQNLARKYGNRGDEDSGEGFHLALACYPRVAESDDND
jgi:DNA-binding transcriptional ArsR family regulator